MTSPELGIVSQDNTAMAGHVAVPPQAGVVISTGGHDDAVERAFEAAVRDASRLGDLLDALVSGRLWLPLTLPGDPRPHAGGQRAEGGGPGSRDPASQHPGSRDPASRQPGSRSGPGEGRRAGLDGAGVRLPTVRYLGDVFVPAYTSAARLLRAIEELAPGDRAGVFPHAVVRAADLARLLPPGLGIALNPGGSESVPVYPAGVAHLAAEHALVGASRVSVGPLGVPVPRELLGLIRTGLSGVRGVRQAATAWLAVDRRGEGVVVSVALDDPADEAARGAALAAVQQAVDAAGGVSWPVDVTFPGESEPDVIDRWVAAHASPFYQRAAGRPETTRPEAALREADALS